MSVTPNYVPREYKTVTVHLHVKDVHKALKFYNDAFGAEIIMKLEDPNGVVIHAEIKIEDTVIMLSEGPIPSGTPSVVLQLYTGDVEALYESAIRAGAEEISPIEKQFYGDRTGRVKDPFGHHWILATHMEDVPPRELQKRFHELYS